MSVASPARKALRVPLVRANIRDDKGTNRPVFVPIYEAALLQLVWQNQPNVTVEIQALSGTGPNGRPWPDDMRFLRTSMAKEEARLREKYRKHPVTKEPIFTQLYGRGEFPGAFARALSGDWSPQEQAPEPVIDDSDLLEESEEPKKPATDKPAPAPAPASEPQDEEAAAPVDEPAADDPEASGATSGKTDDRDSQLADLIRVKGVSRELAGAIIDTLGVTSVAELAQLSADELSQVAGIGPVSASKIAGSAQAIALQE